MHPKRTVSKTVVLLLVASLAGGTLPAQAWSDVVDHTLRQQSDSAGLGESLISSDPLQMLDLAVDTLSGFSQVAPSSVIPAQEPYFPRLLQTEQIQFKGSRTDRVGPVQTFQTQDGFVEFDTHGSDLKIRAGSRSEDMFLRVTDHPSPANPENRRLMVWWGTTSEFPRTAAGLEEWFGTPQESSSIVWESRASEDPLPSRIQYDPTIPALTVTLSSRAKLPKNPLPLIWVDTLGSRPKQLSVRFEIESADSLAGLEEGPSESKIRRDAQIEFEGRQAKRDRRARLIGEAKIRQRLEASETETPVRPPKEEPPARLFPDFEFDGRNWIQVVEARAEQLFEQGQLRIPMGDGEAILLLRGGRMKPYMMVDLIIRPDRNKPTHVYLGRFDTRFGLEGRYWADAAQPYGGEDFDRPEAANYMAENSIDFRTEGSPFRASRVIREGETSQEVFRALYVEHDMAWNLNMEYEDVQAALALAVLEVVRYRGDENFGANLSFVENKYFDELEARRVPVSGFETNATWYRVDDLVWEIRSHFLGRIKIDTQDWVQQVEDGIPSLRSDNLTRISVDGAVAVLLLRNQGDRASIDMLIHREGEPPLLLGRMDMSYDPSRWQFVAGRAHSGLEFKAGAARYLEESGLTSGSGSVFQAAREAHSSAALWVDESVAQELRLEARQVTDALLFTFIQLLHSVGQQNWGVDSSESNSNLNFGRFTDREIPRGEVVELATETTRNILRTRLISSSIRLDAQDWAEQVSMEGWRLFLDGFLEIPIEGGAMVLFYRADPDEELLYVDMVLRLNFRGQHHYVGGIDLSYSDDIDGYLIRGPGGWRRFSTKAAEYLETHRIVPMGESSMFEALRHDPGTGNGYFVAGEIEQFNLPRAAMVDALALVVFDLLDSLHEHRIGIQTGDRFGNTALLIMGLDASMVQADSGENIFIYGVGRLEESIRNRLARAVGGLEELLAITLPRIQEAFRKLSSSASLGWVVLGPTLLDQYPALRVLDPLIDEISIDPGGEGTDLLARRLGAQGWGQEVVYYGTLEERNRFAQAVARQRAGIQVAQDPVLPGQLPSGLKAFLQQLLANMAGWTLGEISELEVDWNQLVWDLELAGEL